MIERLRQRLRRWLEVPEPVPFEQLLDRLGYYYSAPFIKRSQLPTFTGGTLRDDIAKQVDYLQRDISTIYDLYNKREERVGALEVHQARFVDELKNQRLYFTDVFANLAKPSKPPRARPKPRRK